MIKAALAAGLLATAVAASPIWAGEPYAVPPDPVKPYVILTVTSDGVVKVSDPIRTLHLCLEAKQLSLTGRTLEQEAEWQAKVKARNEEIALKAKANDILDNAFRAKWKEDHPSRLPADDCEKKLVKNGDYAYQHGGCSHYSGDDKNAPPWWLMPSGRPENRLPSSLSDSQSYVDATPAARIDIGGPQTITIDPGFYGVRATPFVKYAECIIDAEAQSRD